MCSSPEEAVEVVQVAVGQPHLFALAGQVVEERHGTGCHGPRRFSVRRKRSQSELAVLVDSQQGPRAS
jgi:hypothetical protein